VSDTPHDSLFRFTFGKPENAAALIRANLPEVAARRVDWSSLRLENGSFVDEDAKWRHCDLVFSARIDRKHGFIYVVLEHQSSADPLMPLRMLQYLVRIWNAWLAKHKRAKRIPAVMPIVVYHGDGPWNAPTRLLDLFDLAVAAKADLAPLLPDLHIVLDDLSLRGHELRKRRMPAAALLTALSLVGFPKRDAFTVLAELLDVLRALPADHSGQDTLAAVLCYVFEVASPEPEPERLRAFLARQVGHNASEVAMSAAEKLRQAGKIEGRAEGRAAILLKQLSLKFGSVSAGTRKRVESASIDELDALAERILSAKTLPEVFTAPGARAAKQRAKKKA
jgi:predicted transposase YdaD